jgi:hypothetical protein
MQRALEAGAIQKILPYEQMKDFNARKEYTFEVGREGQIREEFDLHDVILKILGRRPWTVIRSATEAGEFATCDHPVMLRPAGPVSGRMALGFGRRLSIARWCLPRNRNSMLPTTSSFSSTP